MNIRRLVLDVDKAVARPSLLQIAEAISGCRGVEAVNVTVNEIDIETVGTNITIEGEQMDYDAIEKAIEATGAVVHSMDQLVAGNRILEEGKRRR
jgi:hypothetical protein